MSNLNDIVFNPVTGLFENQNDPTAHLTPTQIRQQRNQVRNADPVRAEKKPVFAFARCVNGNEHEAGNPVTLKWRVRKAQRVIVHLPNGNKQTFAPEDSCTFIMPNHTFCVKLIAENEGYKTQRTVTLQPLHKTLLQRAVEWIIQHIM